jgi:hypothetical protein
VAVAMVQSETNGQRVGHSVDPEILLYVEDTPLTGSQARQLAGWLLIAAGSWEEARR